MFQFPATRAEYATVPPSGDKVGDVSSPASSVIRVNWLQRPSIVEGMRCSADDAPLASTATPAIAHGSDDQPRRADGIGSALSTPPADEAVEMVDNVSSANARSLADWTRRSADFSRQRLTIRS